MKENVKSNKSAITLLSGGLLNRCSALTADIMLAYAFGASSSFSIFILAFRMFVLVKRVFSESGLQMMIIVPYIQMFKMESGNKARRFFFRVLKQFLIIQFIAMFIIELLIFVSIKENIVPAASHRLLEYIAILTLAIPFIFVFTMFSALLQSEGRFHVSAYSTTLFNIVGMVLAISIYTYRGSLNYYDLCYIIIIASVAQTILSIAYGMPILSYLKDIKGTKGFSKVSNSSLGKGILLSLISIGTININSLIDTIFCRVSESQGPAYMWYAQRMFLPIVAVVGTAISSSLIPSLSSKFNKGKDEEANKIVVKSYRRSLFLTFPLAALFFVSALPFLSLVLLRGQFDDSDLHSTVLCLWMLVLCTPSSVSIRILYSKYFAQRRLSITTVTSVIGVLLNIVFNMISVYILQWKTYGIALATALSTIIQHAIIHFIFYSEIEVPEIQCNSRKIRESNDYLFSLILISIASGVISIIMSGLFFGDNSLSIMNGMKIHTEDKSMISRLAGIFSVVSVYVFVFMSLSSAFKIRNNIFKMVKGLFSKKIKKYTENSVYHIKDKDI